MNRLPGIPPTCHLVHTAIRQIETSGAVTVSCWSGSEVLDHSEVEPNEGSGWFAEIGHGKGVPAYIIGPFAKEHRIQVGLSIVAAITEKYDAWKTRFQESKDNRCR